MTRRIPYGRFSVKRCQQNSGIENNYSNWPANPLNIIWRKEKKQKNILLVAVQHSTEPSAFVKTLEKEVSELKDQLQLMQYFSIRASQLIFLANRLVEIIVAFNLEIDFSFFGPEKNLRLFFYAWGRLWSRAIKDTNISSFMEVRHT